MQYSLPSTTPRLGIKINAQTNTFSKPNALLFSCLLSRSYITQQHKPDQSAHYSYNTNNTAINTDPATAPTPQHRRPYPPAALLGLSPVGLAPTRPPSPPPAPPPSPSPAASPRCPPTTPVSQTPCTPHRTADAPSASSTVVPAIVTAPPGVSVVAVPRARTGEGVGSEESGVGVPFTRSIIAEGARERVVGGVETVGAPRIVTAGPPAIRVWPSTRNLDIGFGTPLGPAGSGVNVMLPTTICSAMAGGERRCVVAPMTTNEAAGPRLMRVPSSIAVPPGVRV